MNTQHQEYTFHDHDNGHAIACRPEDHGTYERHRNSSGPRTCYVGVYFAGRDNARTEIGEFGGLDALDAAIEAHYVGIVAAEAHCAAPMQLQPNAYEAKLEARRDRLRDRADRARAESSSRYGAARRILDVIPFGQPVLVGHHNERRHRRDLERVDASMRKSAEMSDQAAELERRADAVGTAGISSDDPDALAKLRAHLAARQADRDIEKKWNREIRKRAKAALTRKLAGSGAVGEPDTVHALMREEHVALIAEMAKAGAPAWVVKHMTATARAFPWLPQFVVHTGADIRRIEARIAQLETRDAAPERRYEGALAGTDSGTTFTIEENKAENRVQISFSRRPSAEITHRLGGRGGAGFRWARSIGVWQRQLSNGAWYQACRALGVDPIAAGQRASSAHPEPGPATPEPAPAHVAPEVYACPDGAACQDPGCIAENARRAVAFAMRVGDEAYCLLLKTAGTRSRSGDRQQLNGTARVRVEAIEGDRYHVVILAASGGVVGHRRELARTELYALDRPEERATFEALVRWYWPSQRDACAGREFKPPTAQPPRHPLVEAATAARAPSKRAGCAP